ncbi:HAMP domain-containing protein [Kitasatospora sp. CM 4170]|uniref:histidine kinase n=1 Tax=Kitasatospora aburaviensis TaxID=67265 RepID=A0ABW1ET28_9ACTN|nr:HAMP domain-containing protein [Kitasatospora sp. CM 4170]WNM49932.1 HAMP domain-containing protein [Kitasatospora sp. CM 4170]
MPEDAEQRARAADQGLRQLLAGLTAVRDGDFRTRLAPGQPGVLGEIADVFNGMADQLSRVAAEVTRVAREVGTDGRLGGQADVRDVSGTWLDLTDSVNAMAGNLTWQVRNIAQVTTAVARGDLTQKIEVDARGEILELKITVNTMVDQLSSFADEVTRVAREVGTDGRLGGQAQVPAVAGTWRDLTDSVNSMAGNLTSQVRAIAQVATAVAEGDLTQKVSVAARGEILELKTTINTMVDRLSSFAGEVTRVAREVGTDGRLGGQADVRDVSGTWRDLTESVNVMAENLTAQVRSIAEVTTAVAEGDLTQKIRVDARGEILELKETINTMVDQLSAFADEVTRVAREVGTAGNLGGQATVRGVSGTWKDLTDNVNVMASNLTGQVRSMSEVATAVARGDLSRKVTIEAKGEVAALADAINTMVDTLSAFAGEVTRVAREVGTEGILGGQARVPNVAGTWKDLTENVNSMATNLTNQVRNIAQVTTAVANGDLTRKIDVDARGEILELKTTINTMVDTLSAFAAEVTRVAREVGSEGRLGGQAEVEGVSGTWKRLTENVNGLAGNLTRQVRAIAEVTSAVAAGDLTRSITVDASGEVADLKDNINAMVGSLRETTRANQEQDWLKTNLARFSAAIQGRRDIRAVAEMITDELTPLVGAQFGAFYLVEEAPGGTELALISSYGRPAGEGPQRVRLGESLVGQAARSRREITVDDLPPGYATVASGAGRADARSLVVLPIALEEWLIGVLEFASVHAFTQVHLDFLAQFAEACGVNIGTLLANARTDELLGESQRLTAELQDRSEELQQGQEELRRSNAELEEKAALLAERNRDIEAKNLEIEQGRQELEERARQLTLASMYKSEFLANMSHELRTPLNSLLILAQLLAQNSSGNLTAKQVEYAGVIHSAGSDLLQLINDILDLSKVEAGKMELTPEPFPVRELLEYVDSVFRPLADQKDLAFTVTVDPAVPAELVTDQARLRQVLRNLISNAVKFTDVGQVELRIEHATGVDLPKELGHATAAVAFRVEDTGVGIAPEHLDAVFGAFQQADGTTSRRYGGTGLGLSISRELARLLGGTITIRSVVGEGSCFTLYLPVGPQETAARPAPEGAGAGAGEAAGPAADEANAAGPAAAEPAAGSAPQALVVEPEPPGLLTLLAHSAAAAPGERTAPARIRSVGHPAELRAALGDGPYRCVVLDVGGSADLAREALAALAERGEETAGEEGRGDGWPVLLGYRGNGEAGGAAEPDSGWDGVELIAGLDELRDRMAACLGGARRSDTAAVGAPDGATGRAPADEPLAGRTVLIVDDDVRNVFALTSALEERGVSVLHAADGRAGIDLLRAHPETAVVLMDVMMPGLDGYAAIAAIRADERLARVPIITVTAKAMPGDRDKSLAAGADDHVTKPVDTPALLDRMRDRLAPP